MSSFASTDRPNRTTRIVRWIGVGVPVLLLIACVAAVGWFLFPVVFPQIWANHLSKVQGKVELIVPAQENIDFGQLSPDGRWIVLQPLQERRKEESPFILDLVSGQQHFLSIGMREMRWLNSDQFVVLTSTDNYYLIDIHTFTAVPITIFPEADYKKASDIARVRDIWRRVDKMYAILDFGLSGYTLLTFEQNYPQIYRTSYNFVDQDVKLFIDQVPHTDVPKYGWSTVNITGQRVYSPDGQFYVTREGANRIDVNEHAAIYTRDGQLVASAYKAGWAPYVLGWAHDGSGVYVQFAISGGAATMLIPYKPIFKLSPATPAEQREQLIWMIGTWAVGIVVVGGVGWRLVVRRRVAPK